jgi:hypothetical protein
MLYCIVKIIKNYVKLRSIEVLRRSEFRNIHLIFLLYYRKIYLDTF